MTSLPQNEQAATPTLQTVANSMRSRPELTPLLGSGGWTQEPTVSIANDVVQRIFALGMNWKWNRRNARPFLTVGLQQDYVTNITDCAWVESSTRLDVNNSALPKPWFPMEGVRDLPKTSLQFSPFQVSWVYNYQAVMGRWTPNTAIPCGYGSGYMPTSPVQQFVDENGNILFIDSTVLALGPYSPGTGQTLPDFGTAYPYGTTGTVAPKAPPNSPAGVKVQDGSVIWTVANPRAIAFRLNTVPAPNGITWLICPVYQGKPPSFTSLQQPISPIPPEYAYLFRQGFLAFAQEQAGSPKASASFQRFDEAMMMALRGADREMDETFLYPSDSLSSAGGIGPLPIGPAWPFG